MKITFTQRRFSEAYETDAVDAFIDRLEQALQRGDGSLGAEDVRTVAFAPVRFATGYDMAEVDDFLDHVAIELLEGRMEYDPARDYSVRGDRGAARRSPAAPPRPEPAGSHPAEQRGFLARLFGGGR